MIDFSKIPAYELIREEALPDVRSRGFLLRHKKSGARVLLLENEDDNKVFNIAFRTPVQDNTGVAHIMEHSVLCGSERYPAKDPFVELVKGSMNTFLNAMTYPDKTMFPVASCNEKDFENLTRVYLDAVFFPNIYQREEIFRQEGWTLNLESVEDTLQYNGVVYNEMKGAYSSPDEVLEREIMRSLFPDTTYGCDSGGDPACIPNLTYEQFLAFHRRYYHPSNSYLYLYGSMDFAAMLDWIDREYLDRFEKQSVDSSVRLQAPFSGMQTLCRDYPIGEEEEEEGNTYLSYNVVAGTSLDTRLSNALSVLEYVLLEAPGAPLKQALVEAGIGTDIMGSYDSGVLQPVFSVIAKGADETDAERFHSLVMQQLEEIAAKGLEEKAVKAALNLMEFRFREADYGNYPKGLIYGIDVFDSWLYDEDKPFAYLKQLSDYAFLKEQAGTGYFENLIRSYLLGNPHATMLMLVPKKGLTARLERQLEEELAQKKAAMTVKELEETAERTRKLLSFQQTPDSPEVLAKIPMLRRQDMRKTSLPFANEPVPQKDVLLLHHEYDTNGIAYIRMLFDASTVLPEELPYLGILKSLLGYVDTEHFGYAQLSNEINSRTGGIVAGSSVYPLLEEKGGVVLAFGMQIRTLFDEIDFCYQMAEEILLTSNLRQEKRIKELLNQAKSRLGTHLQEAGSATAATRCMAAFSPYAAVNDAMGGIAFYRVLQDLTEHFEERREDLFGKLETILAKVLSGGMLVSYTGSKEKREQIGALSQQLKEKLNRRSKEAEKEKAEQSGGQTQHEKAEQYVGAAQDERPEQYGGKAKREGEEGKACPLLPYALVPGRPAKEGFTTPGKVQYVACCGNFKEKGFAYTGAMKVLRTILSYEYLWSNVRVMGGAYGCSSSFSRNGDTAFASYRDPHLDRTLQVYEGIPAFLEEFTAEERDMTKYVIGTMSDMDLPLTPSALGARSLNAYLCGLTLSRLQKERDQVLSVTQEEIRALAAPMMAVLEQSGICVVGNEEKLKQKKERFEKLEAL